MPDVWRVFRIDDCRYTNPPKFKYVFIVCKDDDYMGFLVNTGINPYIKKRSWLLECQVKLSQLEYGFLVHDSYLDCSQIYAFEDSELIVGLELISNETKVEIQKVVSKAKTIEKRFQRLIIRGF
jgi:hypothetical protein